MEHVIARNWQEMNPCAEERTKCIKIFLSDCLLQLDLFLMPMLLKPLNQLAEQRRLKFQA